MRRTKIIATLGPASETTEQIDKLIAAGVDIFRLNFSHGTRDSLGQLYGRVRDAARRARRPVAVMQDLPGPKIRIGRLKDGGPVELKAGEPFRLVTGEHVGDATMASTPFAGLAASVSPGTRLLLDDGRIELTVLETDGREIQTEIAHGGTLGERKGINAPGVRFTESGLTKQDVEHLRFGLELGVDMVAVSFVQSASDMEQARVIANEAGNRVWLVAKIERPQAVTDIEAILQVSDAIMVARGDLGLEIPLEQVPRAQKHLTRRARCYGVPVIVATQVLESMRFEARPTRAEVSDAANAVDDGVDAIMLAGETAAGRSPTAAVGVLDAVIRDAESIGPSAFRPDVVPDARHGRALCESAVTLAERSGASVIIAVTHAGTTARQIAALRPRMPIYGATDELATARRLMLCWGVVPVLIDQATLSSGTLPLTMVTDGALPDDTTAVLVRVHSDLTRRDANFVSIQRLIASPTAEPMRASDPTSVGADASVPSKLV